eukprot:1157104-Amphidinium_carterae.1
MSSNTSAWRLDIGWSTYARCSLHICPHRLGLQYHWNPRRITHVGACSSHSCLARVPLTPQAARKEKGKSLGS